MPRPSIVLPIALLLFSSPALAQDPAPSDSGPVSAPYPPAPAPNLAPAPAPADAPAAAPAPAPAPAPPDADANPTMRAVPAERRNGLVLGVAPGLAFAGASGYPNNQSLVGNGDFYSESPLLVGTSTTFFLMGALTDYVSVGPMVNIASFESDKWTSKGFGLGLRGEFFPLVKLFPTLADTAIYGQAGVGSTELQAKGGNFPSADGTQSFAGIGVHHEFRLFRFLGGHFSGGPYAEYDAIFATTAERHWATVGFRMAWYGGGVALDGQ